jgi:hypothetical protein
MDLTGGALLRGRARPPEQTLCSDNSGGHPLARLLASASAKSAGTSARPALRAVGAVTAVGEGVPIE